MTGDVTAGAGEAYVACRTLFEDLNRLATDYLQAMKDQGASFSKEEEYSYSPNELIMKHDHIWVAHRIEPDNQFSFAAAYVIFESGKHHVKVGRAGRPELWFMLGRGTASNINTADLVRSLFMKAELALYKPALSVGGPISYYEYEDPTMDWAVVLRGLELGDIDSPQALKEKVVVPLKAAASAQMINL